MDVFYEESAVASNAKQGEKKYRTLHVLSNVILVLLVFLAIITIANIPLSAEAFPLFLFFLFNTLCLFGIWYVLFRWKRSLNVSYDYSFVSGELRISKVYNINKRRFIARLNCEEILQIGDCDNPSYERLKADPSIKEILCSSNDVPQEGKFFMYIFIDDNGKNLYVLECRETLLMHIMRFAKRTALEHDYVMQEKKQKV